MDFLRVVGCTKIWELDILFRVLLGGLSAIAGCYAAVVLANHATFLLAVNRKVAFLTQCQNQPHKHLCHQPQWLIC